MEQRMIENIKKRHRDIGEDKAVVYDLKSPKDEGEILYS